jgi:hypothetical protein
MRRELYSRWSGYFTVDRHHVAKYQCQDFTQTISTINQSNYTTLQLPTFKIPKPLPQNPSRSRRRAPILRLHLPQPLTRRDFAKQSTNRRRSARRFHAGHWWRRGCTATWRRWGTGWRWRHGWRRRNTCRRSDSRALGARALVVHGREWAWRCHGAKQDGSELLGASLAGPFIVVR